MDAYRRTDHQHLRSLSVEVPVGTGNGLDHASVVNCDNITTMDADALGRQVGYFMTTQELGLTAAIQAAFYLK